MIPRKLPKSLFPLCWFFMYFVANGTPFDNVKQRENLHQNQIPVYLKRKMKINFSAWWSNFPEVVFQRENFFQKLQKKKKSFIFRKIAGGHNGPNFIHSKVHNKFLRVYICVALLGRGGGGHQLIAVFGEVIEALQAFFFLFSNRFGTCSRSVYFAHKSQLTKT